MNTKNASEGDEKDKITRGPKFSRGRKIVRDRKFTKNVERQIFESL